MPARFKLNEAHCRYLPCPGSKALVPHYRWGGFLKSLNLGFSHDQLGISEFVRKGWIRPMMRVILPNTFLTSWQNFPSYPADGTFRQEDLWARQLWGLGSVAVCPSSNPRREGLRGKWYEHTLDKVADPLTIEVRSNVVPTGPESPAPEPIPHHLYPNGISPWIDYFAYWQAYQIVEVLSAIRDSIVVYYGTDKRRQLEAYLENEVGRDELTETELLRIRKKWESNAVVFDWLSRYRTLCGLWDYAMLWQGGIGKEQHEAASKELVSTLGLTDESIRVDIQTVLLKLWQEWSMRLGLENSPILDLLQQDIARSIQLFEAVRGERIDPTSKEWYPQDVHQGVSASLVDALPYEGWLAKRDFPSQAYFYLDRYNESVSQGLKLDEKRISGLLCDHWDQSIPLRRFCRAFMRLHHHFSGNINHGCAVSLVDETPVEFLNLAVFHAERVLVEAHPGAKTGKSPHFGKLLSEAAKRVGRACGANGYNFTREVERIPKDTKLFELPTTLRDRNKDDLDPIWSTGYPFANETCYSSFTPCESFLLATFFNFGVARSYAAHHDCLDDLIIGTPLGRAPVEAVLVVVLTSLLAS